MRRPSEPFVRVVAYNDELIAQFRKNRGVITEGPFTGRHVLLLTTKGAKSGHSRTHPLVYTRDGDRYLIIASKGGSPTHPSWYHNLRAHPEVTVEVGPEKFRAKAIPVARGTERRRLYDQHAKINPGFTDYEKKTDRVIPAILLERLPD
jgi:deazaflavin-dependent oxidoreductase (nitroreductase family)